MPQHLILKAAAADSLCSRQRDIQCVPKAHQAAVAITHCNLLAPDGVLCMHEYSVADSRYSRAVWRMVTAGIVIPLGFAFTGTTSIFTYLRRSVLAFDGVRAIEERMRRAGFTDVRTEPMDGWQRGVVHSFIGRRPG